MVATASATSAAPRQDVAPEVAAAGSPCSDASVAFSYVMPANKAQREKKS